MDRPRVDKALRQIFSDILGLPAENYGYHSSPDSEPDWDSLAHLKIISALEECFDIVIPPEDQIEMMTFELMGDILTERLTASGLKNE